MRIPKAFVDQLGLENGAEVEIGLSDGKVLLTPVMRDYGLEELAAQITPENRHTESDWGPPVGNEGA